MCVNSRSFTTTDGFLAIAVGARGDCAFVLDKRENTDRQERSADGALHRSYLEESSAGIGRAIAHHGDFHLGAGAWPTPNP